MGERKVLNKYYPPDFDPSTIPRRKQPKNQQMKVRMMLPMSIRCNTCGNYIYKGTKFNSRMEQSIETYLGIKIFRFYFKCTKCSSEITYVTDPKNSDYSVESGATRNFEPWRAEDEELERGKRKRDEEETGDAMKSLENRTLDSKQEMNINDTLNEMIIFKTRRATMNVDALGVLQREREEMERRLDEEEEALVSTSYNGSAEADVKRIDDDDDIVEDEDRMSSSLLKRSKLDGGRSSNPTYPLTKVNVLEQGKQKNCEMLRPGEIKTSLAKIAVNKKPKSEPCSKEAKEEESNLTGSRLSKEVGIKQEESLALQSLSQQYGSEDD